LGMIRHRRSERIGKYWLRHCKNADKSNCWKGKAEHLDSPLRRNQLATDENKLRQATALPLRNASYSACEGPCVPPVVAISETPIRVMDSSGLTEPCSASDRVRYLLFFVLAVGPILLDQSGRIRGGVRDRGDSCQAQNEKRRANEVCHRNSSPAVGQRELSGFPHDVDVLGKKIIRTLWIGFMRLKRKRDLRRGMPCRRTTPPSSPSQIRPEWRSYHRPRSLAAPAAPFRPLRPGLD
jgi:hypothetical protein